MTTGSCRQLAERRRTLAALALSAALLLEACAPQVIARGPEAATPRLEAARFVADDGAVMRVRR